jgi:hypothetical protein
MSESFQPPANLKDFDRSQNSAGLYQDWNTFIGGYVAYDAAHYPAFFNPLTIPSGTQAAQAAPQWTGLPRTIKRLVPGSIAAAARMVETAIPMGMRDPMQGNYTPPFFEDATNQPFPGPAYRPQDEYLEWVTNRNPDGTIAEIVFTCEGPEYWQHLAADEVLLVEIYRELTNNSSIVKSDLLFSTDVTWNNPNDPGGPESFKAGDYNPYNKWNIFGAIHLTHPANTLGAEILLAKDGTLLYGKPNIVTTDPDLVCCAAYGGINRMSDPMIGSGVNTQVRLGNKVSLRNPIGLYIRSIDQNAFSLPDGSAFTDVAQCFQISRPAPADVTDMIVRAKFRIPAGITYKGKPLRVSDLSLNGEQITTGGQIADVITITLYAMAMPGAPQQQSVACKYRPCPDATLPSYIHAIPYSQRCPGSGISSLSSNLALFAEEQSSIETPLTHAQPLTGTLRMKHR